MKLKSPRRKMKRMKRTLDRDVKKTMKRVKRVIR